MTYIRHVTLTSGHVRDSYPDEVSPGVLTTLHSVIGQLGAGGATTAVPVPGCPGYHLRGGALGRCLAVDVWSDGPPAALMASIVVAARSRCGAPLWRRMHLWSTLPVVTSAERPPAEPWVGAALQVPVLTDPAIHWLGDLERCLAWAWLTYEGATP